MEKLISLKQLNYSYFGKVPAICNLSMDVNEGALFAIIGHNGSGKSTLLHLMNGLLYPDSGEVLFRNKKLSEQSMADPKFAVEVRKSMGFIFQNPDIQLFCPTVFDELLFAPLQLDLPLELAIERAEETLSFLGISHLRNRAPYLLSGGEKKRVAIGSVLTMNPEVLLVDEPLAGLDPKSQTFFTELLLELHQAGKTIIFTTHQLDLVDHLQPMVAVLSEDHGIQKIAPSSEILNDEDFLISVNLIHKHIHRHGDETHRHIHSHYVFHKH